MRHEDVLQADRNDWNRWDVRCVAEGEVFGRLDDVLMVAPFGSHLYGTADEASDLDIKCLFVESFRRIVLGESRETVRFETGESDGRNAPGDVDVECIELRKFVSDALDGQTYALELLHVPEDQILLDTETWRELRESRERLISRRVEPFVGYCRTQARRYGRKGRRLAAVEAVLEVLEEHDRSERIEETIDELPTDSEFVELIEQPIRGQDEPVVLVEVAGKKFEMHARVKKAVDSLRKVRNAYGDRAERARNGIDWKAISHAYRVNFELRDLLQTGRLEFPLEQSEFVRRVKRGDIPYEQVESEIPELIEETLEMETDLPDTPDREWARRWLVETYRTLAAEEAPR
jgi:hypothetical protein